MSASPKQTLAVVEQEAEADEQRVSLRDGRSLAVGEQGLVEIRNPAGLVELRIQLTEQGPVLQMESVRLSLKASEAVEIESKKVVVHGSEQLALQGGEVTLSAEKDLKVHAGGEVRIVGTMIYLN